MTTTDSLSDDLFGHPTQMTYQILEGSSTCFGFSLAQKLLWLNFLQTCASGPCRRGNEGGCFPRACPLGLFRQDGHHLFYDCLYTLGFPFFRLQEVQLKVGQSRVISGSFAELDFPTSFLSQAHFLPATPHPQSSYTPRCSGSVSEREHVLTRPSKEYSAERFCGTCIVLGNPMLWRLQCTLCKRRE